MALKSDEFPSSAAFDAINDSLQADAKEQEAAIKQGKGVFAFTLKNEAGKTDSWFIDLKDKGVVGKGAAPEGGKATVTLHLSDADFAKIIDGKANAQNLFMSGKLKIKGNIMAAQRLTPVLQRAQNKAKL